MIVAQPLVLHANFRRLANSSASRSALSAGRQTLRSPKDLPTMTSASASSLRSARAAIGDISRGRRALRQMRALAIVGRADLHHRARETQPGAGILRRRCNCLPEQLQAAAEIVFLERSFRLAAQLRGRFLHQPGIGLDLRLQPDRGVGQILALKVLLGRWAVCAAAGTAETARHAKATSAAKRPARRRARTSGNSSCPKRGASTHHQVNAESCRGRDREPVRAEILTGTGRVDRPSASGPKFRSQWRLPKEAWKTASTGSKITLSRFGYTDEITDESGSCLARLRPTLFARKFRLECRQRSRSSVG